MEITEVRIKLMDDPHDRLQAFCSITFDECFVIRDLKIIQGTKGSFVAMPSRKLTDRCPRCHSKNHLRALHCNQCGAKLDEERATRDQEGRAKLYADIAHPINSECREMIQQQVLGAYEEEIVKANQPGYICTYDDYGEEHYATLKDPEEQEVFSVAASAHEESSYHNSARRIEPAAEQQPGPPHHAPHHSVGHASRERESVPAATEGRRRHGSDDDEPFGAGLV